MKIDLLEALSRKLAEAQKLGAAHVVQSLHATGLLVSAETGTGTGAVSVEVDDLARIIEGLVELSPGLASAEAAPRSLPTRPRRPLLDQHARQELADASRQAQGRVRAVLEGEPDPDRQWQRVVAMLHEGDRRPSRDIECDLTDDSFLYSR